MQKSQTIGELAKALAIAQGEIEGAKKDSENPYFKSKYADLAAVRDACQEALSKQGIAVVQVPTTVISEHATTVQVETLMMHSSGEWISGDLGAIPVKDDPQGIGSCITYLRRYALASFAGVAPEDDDGNAASQGNGQRPANRNAPKGNYPKSNSAETTEIKKSLVDVCKLLNAVGDKPVWGAKRLDEFSVQEYGKKADDLEIEPLRELLKKLSNKYDLLKNATNAPKAPEPAPETDRLETERLAKIQEIKGKFHEKAIEQGLADLAKSTQRLGLTLEMLTLDELVALSEELVPF